MASYNIVFKPSVEKDLRSLPSSLIERLVKHLETLKDNPFPRQSIKLAGSEQLYRLRVGVYRIVYAVDSAAKRITVHYIRHRRDAYRDL
jgi:mRNA interferase RelE/StbE